MLHSPLHHPGNTILALTGLFILVISFSVHSDTRPVSTSYNTDYLLSLYETNLSATNADWQENMVGNRGYYEGGEAMHKLTENALKYYWQVLMGGNQSYFRYFPIIPQHFTVGNESIDYGIGFSGNAVKFRFDYSF